MVHMMRRRDRTTRMPILVKRVRESKLFAAHGRHGTAHHAIHASRVVATCSAVMCLSVGLVCARLAWASSSFWALTGFLVTRSIGLSYSKSDASRIEFNVSNFLRKTYNNVRSPETPRRQDLSLLHQPRNPQERRHPPLRFSLEFRLNSILDYHHAFFCISSNLLWNWIGRIKSIVKDGECKERNKEKKKNGKIVFVHWAY